ncbi:MAG TPA: hypothetical protein VGB07_16955 [Blastocatellia bacterium]
MEPNEQNFDFAGKQLNRPYNQMNPDQAQERNGSTFDQVKSTVAEKLRSAAESLHQTASRSTKQNDLTGFGHQAADWLGRSADYVSEIEPARVRSDIESGVRKNPGRSLLIAGAVGLVLGGLLRRR